MQLTIFSHYANLTHDGSQPANSLSLLQQRKVWSDFHIAVGQFAFIEHQLAVAAILILYLSHTHAHTHMRRLVYECI